MRTFCETVLDDQKLEMIARERRGREDSGRWKREVSYP